MKVFYRPVFYVFIDVFLLIINILIVLGWFPLTTQEPFYKYASLFLFFCIVWLLSSYLLGRYRPLKGQRYFKSTFRLFYVAVISFALTWYEFILGEPDKHLSQYVLFSVTVLGFACNYIFFLVYFAYRYAVDYEVTESPVAERENAKEKRLPPLDDETYQSRCLLIESNSGERVLSFLEKDIPLRSGNTIVFVQRTLDELFSLQEYKYSCFVKLESLNKMRGINRMLRAINEKIADDGIFVCCFEPQNERKKRIRKQYPVVIKEFVVFFDFLVNRVIPKFFLTRRLYYDVTGGKNRILSKTEVMGRLYYSGFEVVRDKKIENRLFVVAKRAKQAEPLAVKRYGPLIRLRRYGKNGKQFDVYKFRTMYSYSEYLQKYIYEHYNLQKGGKFKNDIRVTSIGRFMRKYWIDELPMFINLLKGDMKLIGVRPLSAHFFSLYTEELQQKRIQSKPGLLPPFYADMPQTLDEIQASEMKYLQACEKNGVFFTDFKYFFLILRNIFFKKARSA